MKMKRRIALLLVAVLVMGVLAGCGGDKSDGADAPEGDQPAKGGTTFLSIATGGTGGTYYPLGGALSNIFNGSDMGLQATAQSTGASVENVELIHNGEAEIAFIQNDIAYYAFNGIELFGEGEIEKDGKVEKREKREYPDIRGLCTLYPEVVQIIAADGSGIESVEDMKGKKVAVGAPGSGTEVNARQVLAAHGLTYDDLGKADYLSFSEATDQIKNGQVDAAFVVAAIPSSSVTELATTHDIHLVPIAEDKANALIADYPYYTYMDIQPGDYKGQEEPVAAVAVQAMLIVNESMDEDLVYNLTKNMFENLNVIEESHARGKDITLESALEGMSIELHPGAKKFFDEEGIK
ncbi:MAG: TAXI family TRAP transporter solute-binding subunit [Tissierellia bacterium]|nr:TAXI family TRAP transporter solute-binding subunit [Tissierellia bacterium]